MSNTLQVVGIFNFEDIGEFGAGEINAFLSGAETRIIHHGWSSHAGYYFSRIGIHNVKLGGLPSPNIQAMISRIERDCGETLGICNGPCRNYRALIPVDDFDGAVATNVDEHARTRRIESQ